VIGFCATWLGPLLHCDVEHEDSTNEGDPVEEGPREHEQLVAQARLLLEVIREMEGHPLTLDEAGALATLIRALRELLGEEDDAQDLDAQP
jgi:hypothetical protein